MRAALAALVGIGLMVPATLVAPSPADAAEPNRDPAASVNTFIGTQDQGNTFPGASAPFGMAQVSPTGSHFAGWQYDETDIRGFGHSYISGAGCWEQGGQLSALPTTGEVAPGGAFDTTDPGTFDHERYAAEMTHEGEVGTAGYYRTRLTSYGGIDVETTATTRVGLQRYTFPATESANVLLNVGQANETLGVTGSSVAIVDDRTVVSEVRVRGFCNDQGFAYTTWFATRFDRPFETMGTWNADGGQPGVLAQSLESGLRGAWVTFDTTEDSVVQLSTGLSFTGAEGALANLEAEGLDAAGDVLPFDDVATATRAEWNAELGAATAFGGTDDDQASFTTALYHSFLQPITSSDVDGGYRGFDDAIHVAQGWTYYQWFSLWDTYRTQNQLLAMLQPDRATDIARSVLTIREQGGWLPRWGYANYESNVMTGDPVVPFLADLWRYGAVQPGVTLAADDTLSGTAVALDERLLLEALLESVDSAPPADSQFAGRSAVEDYIALGYVPQDAAAPSLGMDTDEHYAGSATMEYAIGDCAASVVAEGLGDAASAERLAARAHSWANVWDPTSTTGPYEGLPRARTADGGWVDGDSGFQEGTPSQYQWLAWQDADGLAAMMGGTDAAIDRLDAFFDIDRVRTDPAGAASESWVSGTLDYTRIEYNPNNEPNLHAPWMYSFFGEPSSTSAVNRAAQTLFTNAPDGVTGNDDLGTMSAWYVFSAIGLYPSVPGTGELLLHAPRFPRVDLDLGDAILTIEAEGADGAAMQYVAGVAADGVAIEQSFVDWDAVRDGGVLDIDLTTDATTTWGQGQAARPTAPCSSVADVVPPTVDLAIEPTPPASGWATGPVSVRATAADDRTAAPEIELRVDGGAWQPYDGPLLLEDSGEWIVEARARDDAGLVSETASARAAIDAEAPVTTAEVVPAAEETEGAAAPVSLVVTAQDAHSGVASTEYRIGDEGAWQPIGAATAGAATAGVATAGAVTAGAVTAGAVTIGIDPGAETVAWLRSIDVAGNAEQPVRVALDVEAPSPPVSTPPSSSGGAAPSDGSAAALPVTGAASLWGATLLVGMLLALVGGLLRGRRRRA